MKDNVEIYTMALIQVIRESPEYRAYEEVKQQVARDPELKKKIDEYRLECFRLQNSTDGGDLYEQTNEFISRNQEFRKNMLVDRYLQRELAVCRMLQGIARKVAGAVDLELDGMADRIP